MGDETTEEEELGESGTGDFEYTADLISAIATAVEVYNKEVLEFRKQLGLDNPTSMVDGYVFFVSLSTSIVNKANTITQNATSETSESQADATAESVLSFRTDVENELSIVTEIEQTGPPVIVEVSSSVIDEYQSKFDDFKQMSFPEKEDAGIAEDLSAHRAQMKAATKAIEALQTILEKMKELQDQADENTNLEEALSGADENSSQDQMNAILDAQKNERLQQAAAAAQQANERKKRNEAVAAAVSGSMTQTQILYKEQCFLMARIHSLLDYKLTTTSNGLPYTSGNGNTSILAAGEPYAFMNKLTQYPNTKEFYEMEPGHLSNLVPMIRLYKVSADKKTGEETQVELHFNANPTYNEIQSYFKDKNKRGFGAGIKDFSFTYDGHNPFAAKKSIKAKLVLFANGIDELFKCRGAGKCDSDEVEKYSRSYRYIDLALKTGGAKAAKKASGDAAKNLDKLNFRLKAVVGWALPKGFPNALDNPALLTALNNSYVTLNLTPTIHEFDLNEMGGVTFTIDYLAYVEEFFDQPQFNIFADPELSARMLLRKLIFTNITNSSKCQASEISELKKQEADGIAIEKKASLEFITKQLLQVGPDGKSKVKYINLSRIELVKFQNEGVFYEPPQDVTGLIVDTVDDHAVTKAAMAEKTKSDAEKKESGGDSKKEPTEEEKKFEFSKLMMAPDAEQIPFFFVSDLIDIILEGIGINLKQLPRNLMTEFANIDDNFPTAKAGLVDKTTLRAQMHEQQSIIYQFEKRYQKLRVVLGPLGVRDPKGVFIKNVSLGDLPISFKYFIEWMTKKLLALDETEYHLAKFINDFFNTLIKEFLNNDTCFKINTNQKTRLSQAVLTSYKPTKVWHTPDDLTHAINLQGAVPPRLDMNKVTEEHMPLLNISGPKDLPIVHRPVTDETNYLIFFAGRVAPPEKMNGDRAEDHKRGVFHFSMGENRGLVKKISLQKTSAKFLKEVRFEQDGYDGLKQLREVYDVTIDAFPIVNAYPGVYVYVDPMGWLPNAGLPGSDSPLDLTQYGIGGYHMIWKSEHSFAAGRAESKIHAKWVASIGMTAASKEALDPAAADPATSADGGAAKTPSKCAVVIEDLKTAATDPPKVEDPPGTSATTTSSTPTGRVGAAGTGGFR